MGTLELIKEIQKLPFAERIYIIEKVVNSIRKTENKNQMQIAAESMVNEYKSNEELTLFTNIDFEEFYETK